MKEEKVSTQRKICITNEVLEALETYCIAQRKTLQYVIEEVLHYNYGYASQCFKKVTQITLSKYVNRRILTEVYRKHMQEYEGYTREESVDGIKNFKRRMKAEFGDPVEKILEFLVAYHDGNRNEIPGPFSFSICNLESDGRWEKRNLISSFEVSLENKVLEIKLAPQWLKWEDNNLYLYLE